ncbi:MAG: hypothetical protein LJE83_10815 [Gammaproteobacteria bacterium]|nr:hypothetical protein [Gammaproteobacteria bacterium]
MCKISVTNDIQYFIVIPLTARDMGRTYSPVTNTRMDAGVEPPWMVHE